MSHPGSGDGVRYFPGAVVAERYRVVALLGRGGMGEVYRADDLRLGQAVALKFLPPDLAGDADRLARFTNEVRVARQITHPSVCRVHDIGEHDGQPFLSMEYVDGENLASLLRRIGRLPIDKVVEIARQVCAGLAAAHERSVLHRDLKPDNVMIDGRGRARITDFGLAGLADLITGDEVRSGTPAYMSPEQLAGREVSPRSDVYALGLVLYEMITGRRPFKGRTYQELARQHADEVPAAPGTLVPGLDPGIEAVVMRCLEKDPARRPPTPLAVSAALPGGDPLAEALAAGQVPSPDMVAAAGGDECLTPGKAMGALWLAVAGALTTIALNGSGGLPAYQPFTKPPQVLEDRAREVLTSLGQGARPAGSAHGFVADVEYLEHVAASPDADRWSRLHSGPPTARFWYRQGPRPLVPRSMRDRIDWEDPPLDLSGMAGVQVDMEGRLVELYVVPPQREGEPTAAAGPAEDAEWERLLRLAGFDPAQLTPVPPRWTPPFYVDARRAWQGTWPGGHAEPLRVEAGSYRGRPVWFTTVGEWTRPGRMQRYEPAAAVRVAEHLSLALVLGVIALGAWLARRNLRSGLGDRRGALRLAAAVFTTTLVVWALGVDHVAEVRGELSLLVRGLANALFASALLWMLYVAIEPHVRKVWPHALIAWTRLLAGGTRDPLVGRHLLVGALGGIAFALAGTVVDAAPTWLGLPRSTPSWFNLDLLLSPARALGGSCAQAVDAVALGTGFFVLLVILRASTGRERFAAVVIASVLGLVVALRSELPLALGAPLFAAMWGLPLLIMIRHGLLAALTCFYFLSVLLNFPLHLDVGHWSAPSVLAALLPPAALLVHAYRAACTFPPPAARRDTGGPL